MTGVEDVRSRRRERVRKRLVTQTSNRSTMALLAALGIAGVLVLLVLGGLAMVENRNQRIGQAPTAREPTTDASVVLTLPSEPAPTISIDADAIRLNDAVVVKLEDGAIAADSLDADGNISALLEPLRARAQAGGRRCRLTATPETPFRLLSRVHATARFAGLSRVEVVDRRSVGP